MENEIGRTATPLSGPPRHTSQGTVFYSVLRLHNDLVMQKRSKNEAENHEHAKLCM